jgi:hypothetical protein
MLPMLLASLIVSATGLGFGFFLDDHLHILTIDGHLDFGAPFDLFRFGTGNPEENLNHIHLGPKPWYSALEFKAHFMRPLSCATMVLDRRLFGEHAVFYHAHSMIWYLALVFAAGLLLRRVLPGSLGALTLLLFAIDEAHWFPAVWWSNRNATIAATFALFGLLAHIRAREDGWWRGHPLAILCFALGLLAGETALGIFGYLAAYECFAAPGGPRRRIMALIPAGLLALVYAITYKTLGYGAGASGIYFDPIGAWPQFLLHAPGRFLLLFGTQFFSLPVDLAILAPHIKLPLMMGGLLTVPLLLLGLRLAWRHLDSTERRVLTWLATGAGLAVLPVLSTFASGRLLTLPSLGGAVIIATLIRHGWRMRGDGAISPRRWPVLLGAGLAVLHLVLAPLAWPLQTATLRFASKAAEQVILDAPIAEETAAQQEVVVVNAENPIFGFYPIIIRMRYDRPIPQTWRTLSVAPCDHYIHRTAPDTIEISLAAPVPMTDFELLVSDPEDPPQAGDIVTLDGLEIEVLETYGLRVTRFACRFDAPLEDPRYLFLALGKDGLRPMTLPSPGETILLTRERILGIR